MALDRADASMATIAVGQHGNITRAQLLALGASDSLIAHRVRTGRLYRTFVGVYAVGRPAHSPIERAAAAVLACGPYAALSHASAMTLWGFWKRWDVPFEVTVARGNPRPRNIVVHRSRTLGREDVATQLGIRVTSPARTMFDIVPRLSHPAVARMVDDGLHSVFLTRSDLVRQLHRNANARAAARLRPLLSTADGPSRSDWERAFPAFCRRHGLPRPRLNTVVCGYEVDALFADEKLIVELDGWAFHASRDAFERDRNRDADTLCAGFATVRITWRRITGTPVDEAERLGAILAARRAG